MVNKPDSFPPVILELMAEKTALLSKAHALATMGLAEAVQPLWLTAAACEERLAPLLETIGRDREAAVHRISAASCYQKGGEPNRAVNLYRAALAGPLAESTRQDVLVMLAASLAEVAQIPPKKRSGGRARTKV